MGAKAPHPSSGTPPKLRKAYDLNLGYAMTVHKAEGSSLKQMALVFEEFAPPGWAYTGVTRTTSAKGLAVIGAPRREHFPPR